MLSAIGLLVVLLACGIARAFEALLGALRIDAAEALLYFGLAEERHR